MCLHNYFISQAQNCHFSYKVASQIPDYIFESTPDERLGSYQLFTGSYSFSIESEHQEYALFFSIFKVC